MLVDEEFGDNYENMDNIMEALLILIDRLQKLE
jgi:hypothetical protein